jgi:hypothetical protein
VRLNNVDIPHSNISDLISDAVRKRKNFNPTGSKEFFRVLSKINIPTDLVRNDERWKQALTDSSSAEEEVLYRSPSKVALTPQKKHVEKTEPIFKPRWFNY